MFINAACVIFLIMWTQVGHVVSLKASMPKEHSILNNSAVGLLAQSVSYCTDFTIRKSFLHTSQMWLFNYGSKGFRPLEMKGVTFVVDCAIMCANSCQKKV